jgi:hypothetical protein
MAGLESPQFAERAGYGGGSGEESLSKPGDGLNDKVRIEFASGNA